MADPNTRQGKRTPVTLKIKFKSETLEQFIERYAVDVSQGGIFIRTKEPLAVGTQMRFEFQLRDASPLIAGEGTVVWTRENDPSRPAIAPGMGVRFDRLAEGSQAVLERILNEKAKQAPARPAGENTKPPMFTDTPTRVAPAPVQEALLGSDTPTRASQPLKRHDEFNESTPLPRPMPFHGDQDDFDAGAFDEATKVRALDELIAQTAPDSTVADLSTASVAAQDAQAAKAAKPVERDSAPTLPSPPDAPRASGKIPTVQPTNTTATADVTLTGSGVAESATPAKSALSEPSSSASMRTQIGVEPAKAPTKSTTVPPASTTKTSSAGSASKETGKAAARTAAATEPVKRPEAKSGGGPGMAIVALLIIAVAVASVWFFVLRKKDQTTGGTTGSGDIASGAGTASGSAETPPPVGSGSAVTTVGSGSADVGSGSADVGSGSNVAATTGSNTPTNVGSGSAPAPAAQLVDMTITADAQKATIEISGGPSGPAPLKAKLEKDKVYKIRVTAPGYAELSMDVKGGDPKAMAKLTLKPRVVSVTSEPAGAAIFVDNAATGKVTPSDIELTKAQASKRSVIVSLRKTGFKAVQNALDASKWTESGAKLTASVDAKLVVQQIVRPPPPQPTGSGSAAPTGDGSGTTPPPTGDGSAATPTPPPPPPPTGGEPSEDQLN